MWPSSAGIKSNRNAVSSSSSKSSSTCLCPPPFSPAAARKSMEEIWKGIDLSSLHHRRRHHSAVASNHGLNPRNFSSRPSVKDPQTGDDRSNKSREPVSARCGGAAVFAPPPATALSLNSFGPELRLLESSDRIRSSPQTQNHANGGSDPNFLSPFEALSPCTDFPSFCKKRASDQNDENSGNWRHKRKMKNRESATRSRARKQAYAKGLENEVARLREENERLRRQLEMFTSAAPAQVPKRKTLHRTLTAPF